MHAFGKLVFLDVQKTGSTYVSAFLKAACKSSETRFSKHGRIRGDHDPESFYFISVRDPLEQYRSLFRYGLDRRGGLFTRLRRAGLEGIYQPSQDGFEAFLRFLLDPGNARFLKEQYERFASELDVGFMTHRHLMLSFCNPVSVLKSTSRAQLAACYKEQRIWRHAVRQERLVEDLKQLVETAPEHFDPDRAKAFLDRPEKVNASQRGSDISTQLSPDLMQLLRDKERLIFENFYAGAAKGH